jgi:hypothetical protein
MFKMRDPKMLNDHQTPVVVSLKFEQGAQRTQSKTQRTQSR